MSAALKQASAIFPKFAMDTLENVQKICTWKIRFRVVVVTDIALMVCALLWINSVRCFGVDRQESRTHSVLMNLTKEEPRQGIAEKLNTIVLNHVKWSK